MDEEFESFVVTNPDLVDEGIDVSGLKTNTDASILGNIPDYGGIQYEAYNPNRLSDLMRLYSGGFPMLDAPQAVAPVVDATPVVDTGGGGGMDQATGDSVAGFDPGVTPGPSGFIGLDPDMDINTQDITDYGTYDPPELGGADGMSGGQATPGAEFADQNPYGGDGTMDDLGADSFPDFDFGPQPGISNPRAPGQNTITQDTTSMGTTPSAPPGILNPYQEPMTQQDLIDSDANVGFGNAPSFEPEQQGLIDQAFSKVGSTAETIMDDLSKIPGAVANFAEQTVDVFGKKINVGKTLLNAGINKLVGGPISLVFDAIGALGLEGGRGDVSDSLAEKYGRDDIGRLTGGPMEGYSVGPNFTETVQERIDNIKNRTAPQTDASRKTIEELETIKAEAIAAGSGGVITEPGTVVGPGEFPDTQETFDEFNEVETFNPGDVEAGLGTETINDITSETANDGGFGNTEGPRGGDPYGGGEGGVQSGMDTPTADDGFGGYEQGAFADDATGSDTSPGATGGEGGFDDNSFSDANTGFDTSPGATGGEGGSGNGGGKIVCTMMNDSYGFGSFRNKIWLKHSKNMAPEYQIGYHKIFLPLVKLSKTNNVVKKVLEHIAIHRTIDIRQESRGKTHLLGRVYRKILEPICYIVGKYAK